MNTLEQWDRYIAPHLRDIEEISTQISIRARWITLDLAELTSRPEWTTKAEAALEKAETDLQEALARIQQARFEFRNIPIMQAAE